MAHAIRTAGRTARVTGLIKRLLTSMRSLTDTSRVASRVDPLILMLRHSWDRSATDSGISHGLMAAGRARQGSLVAGFALRLVGPLDKALDRSAITYSARWTEAAVQASRLYRWLTAEPEPEVIVIDLRETLSVGPFIAALDQLIRWLVPASHRSTVVGVAESVHQSVRTAPVRAASLVLGVAVLTNLGVTLATGELTQVGVVARIVLLGLAALGTRVTMTWDELVETRTVQLAIAALEPPEPPNDE